MTKQPKPEPQTSAFHFSSEDHSKHVVGIGDLRVLISQEGNHWIAQGLEIDYFAYGDSVESSKEAFQSGLTATIREHLRIYGTIEKLLTVAPKDVWAALMAAGSYKLHSQVSFHELPKFAGIVYLQAA